MKKKATPKMRVVLREQDLRRQVFRAGGPGGQHQNKTESAVRYTHLPTGVSAESRSERSQSVNDAKARELLEQKLLMLWMLKEKKSAKDAWATKPSVAFGSQMRSYVLSGGTPHVTDHGTGHSEANPRAVLSGKIDGFLRASMVQSAREEKEES